MNRSYYNIGLTTREGQIWPPRKPKSVSFLQIALGFLVWAVIVVLFIHFFVPNKGGPIVKTAYAEATTTPALYSQPDDVQEAAFCDQIMNGVKVHGANASQIELHCITHG